ncbi:hypothetical protein ACSVC9_08150 [Clostridium sp. LBM24168]
MQINSITKSSNNMYRNLNYKYKDNHRENNKNNISFYEILEQAISYRIRENCISGISSDLYKIK